MTSTENAIEAPGAVSRRALLRRSGGIVLAGIGVSLLAACGGSAPATPPTSAPAAAVPTLPPNPAAETVVAAATPASGGATAAPTASEAAATSVAPNPTPVPANDAPPKNSLLPTHVAVDGPRPDMPSGIPEVPDGYFTFPKQLFTSVAEAPG